MTAAISLNADIGEGYGRWRVAEDETLLSLVSDANVACGFHAGDPDIIRQTCRTAATRGVGVGAHPGFLDLRGFGRRFVAVPAESVTNDVLYQLGGLESLAGSARVRMSYVKPHGALSHAAIADETVADAIISAILAKDPNLPLLIQPGTTFARRADAHGVQVIPEGFVDRAYTADGLLVPRERPGALVTDVEQSCAQALRMALHHEVETIDGQVIAMPVESLCIHSDSPGAVEMATAVRRALEQAGVSVTSFTRSTVP